MSEKINMPEKRKLPFISNAVVVYVLRKTAQGMEVLFLKRNKGNDLDKYWLHVAGGIEQGEKASETALRELHEETGLVPERFYSANYCEQFYSVYDDAIIMLPLFVAFVPADAKVLINHEHSDFRWFSVEEAFQVAPFANQRENLRIVNENFILREPAEFSRIKVGG